MNPSQDDDIKKLCERLVVTLRDAPKGHPDHDTLTLARYVLDRLGEQTKPDNGAVVDGVRTAFADQPDALKNRIVLFVNFLERQPPAAPSSIDLVPVQETPK